ncbi:tetratricopeptide repeat protein [Sphingomonas sp. GB1N7]|uniref:tetratricopeptide repeat protein n=1 Tax=Parasphingomonas caseinilytica TaxID=3096158 RepID=UPI002FCCA8CA
MRMLVAAMALLGTAAVPSLVEAQDHTGYRQIATGNYARAERTLTSELKSFPQRPELMLNLAAIYVRTDRAADARALYAAVLAQPDVLMDLSADTTAWSHALAQRGLRQLAGIQLSSR